MDWIRQWIMEIAGIIVLGSLCDMIMPDGNMKKYVKMVVGLILVFAVLRPISGFADRTVEIDVPEDTRMRAIELQKQIDKVEQQKIMDLYSQKLEKKISEGIREKFGCEVQISVMIETETESEFGSISHVEVRICDETVKVDVESVKGFVGGNFGVNKNHVTVECAD